MTALVGSAMFGWRPPLDCWAPDSPHRDHAAGVAWWVPAGTDVAWPTSADEALDGGWRYAGAVGERDGLLAQLVPDDPPTGLGDGLGGPSPWRIPPPMSPRLLVRWRDLHLLPPAGLVVDLVLDHRNQRERVVMPAARIGPMDASLKAGQPATGVSIVGTDGGAPWSVYYDAAELRAE
ncbi:MAG: hypothetical protein EPO06_11740 [Burkholderiaceae bacterium]|nr:MAG: hypothetical protein EPO06_11740 [Burkholderiaceae bacterium]